MWPPHASDGQGISAARRRFSGLAAIRPCVQWAKEVTGSQVYDEHCDYPMALLQLDSPSYVVAPQQRGPLQEKHRHRRHLPTRGAGGRAGKVTSCQLPPPAARVRRRARGCGAWRCGDGHGTSVGRAEHALLERLDTCDLCRARGDLRAHQPQARGPEGRARLADQRRRDPARDGGRYRGGRAVVPARLEHMVCPHLRGEPGPRPARP